MTELHAEKRVFPVERQPTTEAGDPHRPVPRPLRRARRSDRRRRLDGARLYHNPLALWIWVGAGIMALGGLVSLSDRRLRVGAPKPPARGAGLPEPPRRDQRRPSGAGSLVLLIHRWPCSSAWSACFLAIGLTRDPGDAALGADRQAGAAVRPAAAGRAQPAGLATADLTDGQAALVNVFASWCVPCRVEHPLLMRLSARRACAIYGINYKDKPEDAAAPSCSELGDPFRRIGVDRDGRVGIDWGVYGVPETYVIDRRRPDRATAMSAH